MLLIIIIYKNKYTIYIYINPLYAVVNILIN